MTSLGGFYPGANAETQPESAALIDGESGAVVTYRELDANAWRIARFFRSAGADARDNVALCMENSTTYVQLLWGAHYGGLAYTPMSTKLKADEIVYIVRNSGARVLLVSARLPDDVKVSLRESLADVHITELDVAQGFPADISDQSAEPLAEAVEGMPVLYSSGTTGRPKAIRPAFPEGLLGSNSSVLVAMLGMLFGVDRNSVYLSPAPLYHAAPLGYVQAIGQIGAAVVVMPKFDPARFLDLVQEHRITHTQVVPTMFTRLLRLPQADREAIDVSSLTHVIHAAAPCPAPVKRAMFDWLGPIIHEYYSGSEGVGFTYCSPQDWLQHPGSVGKSMLGAIHILDENGGELPVGDDGLIYFESARQFEYLGEPEKTREVFKPNGWGTFGDIGHVDADGFLYLTDRSNDMIISGGVNVYPRETEEALLTHEAVNDAAVIGVPDDDFGQRVVAVVSLRGGHSADPALGDALIEYCRERISNLKCPREVLFANEIPRTETGKLLRREVRATYVALAKTP